MSKHNRALHLPLLLAGSLMLILSSLFMTTFIVQFTGGDDTGSLDFAEWINEKRVLFERSGKGSASFDIHGDFNKEPDSRNSYWGGGSLLWKRKVLEGSDEPISTPVLVDLDGYGNTEVVALTSDDAVMAFDCSGNPFWEAPYTDIVIEFLGQTAGTSGLDFDPPHFFGSPKAFNSNDALGPNILIGAKDGIHCLDKDGNRAWVGGSTVGWYFSPPAISDLEGEFKDGMMDWEIITVSDDASRRGWVEIMEINGSVIERIEAPTGGEGGLIATAAVVEDLDGSYWNGPWKTEPEPWDERTLEVTCGNHDRGLRIWKKDGVNNDGGPRLKETTTGWLAGHQTYATHAVANVSGSPEMELFVGSSEGYPRTWTGWGGKLYVYTPDGKKLWDYSTGSSRASIFSSPAVADIQMSKFDPDEVELEYEVIFGSDNNRLYVMNTMTHSLEWSFDTGGRCMSSPAVCDIYSDNELEIIVGSDSGKVFCLDGDPTDNIDEGIEYPGDGYEYDVLWVYDAKVPIGISSPVVADIERDGILEVIIGDTEGNIHCISAGGNCEKGQVDWPSFHNNNNNTGFYNPDESSYIDLHPRVFEDGSKESTTVIVKPGTSHKFDLTVRYDGTMDYSGRKAIYIRVKNGTLPEGWKADIKNPPIGDETDPDHVILRKGQRSDLSVTIQAPLSSSEPITAHIVIVANLSMDTWVMDTLLLQVKLDLYPGVDVSFESAVEDDPLSPQVGKKWAPVSPGGQFDIDVILENTGTINDTMNIELYEPPIEAGWNWFFLGTGRTSLDIDLIPSHLVGKLPGSNVKILTVRIMCSKDAFAGQEISITITAGSSAASNVFGTNISSVDVFHVVITQENGLWLDIVESSVQALPGSTEEVRLRITNLGNQDVIRVRLTNDTLPDGWIVEFSDDLIGVYRGQTRTISCSVQPPEGAVAGSSAILTLRGRITDQPHICSHSTVVAQVGQVHEHEVLLYGDEMKDGYPGTDVSFDLMVLNEGNGPEDFSFAPVMPSGWSFKLMDQAGREIESTIADPFSQVILRVNFTIGMDTLAGLNSVVLKIVSENGTSFIGFNIWVLQVRDLEITSLEGTGRINLDTQLNRLSKAVFVITNTGNGLDRANIIIGGKGIYGTLIEVPQGAEVGLFSVSNNKDQKGETDFWNVSRPLDLTDSRSPGVFIPDQNRITGPLSGDKPITDLSIELRPGSSAYVEIWIRMDNGIDDKGSHDLLVAAYCEGVRKVLPIEVELNYPDLFFFGGMEIAGSTRDGELKANEGDRLTFIVKLGNRGEVHAKDVTVQLYVDNRPVTNLTLPNVPISLTDSKIVMLTWEAEEGRHNIRIVIDPHDSIVEQSEITIDNEIGTRIDVEGEGFSLTSGSSLLIISLALGFLVPIVIVTAILGFKKKKEK